MPILELANISKRRMICLPRLFEGQNTLRTVSRDLRHRLKGYLVEVLGVLFRIGQLSREPSRRGVCLFALRVVS